MSEDVWHRRVMAGEGAWTLPLRGVLWACSAGYGAAIALRNRRYDRGMGVTTVGVPVISVGNITVGGTGKTPLVIELAQRLQSAGHKVAVVSRGYKADAGGQADELLLVARRVPDAVCVAQPDRVAAARRVIREHGVSAIVLDDAFQHRRIGRDLDIVTIDATCPFGFGHLLPRGLLREPLRSLRRADLLIVTRADQVADDALLALHEQLDSLAPGVPRVSCHHLSAGYVDVDGQPAELPGGGDCRAVCFSAIGNPGAFERTVCGTGVEVVDRVRWPDHHRYTAADLARVSDVASAARADVLITTEKDAVKLRQLSVDQACQVLALRIDIDFVADGDTIVAAGIERALRKKRGPNG